MSEAQPRPATRGRSTTRGRGGYRGAPRSKNLGAEPLDIVDHTADDGELLELKQRYGSQLTTLKEMFPDWTNMDLLLGLQDCDGDLTTTIDKITEGHVSQFSEISKKTKDRSRSKAAAKDVPAAVSEATTAPTRATRGRGGYESTRGGRGRGDRGGRGGTRGGRGGASVAPANGATSVATADSNAWANDTIDTVEKVADETAAKVEAAPETVLPPAETGTPAKKTWASMFSQPKPPPAVPKLAVPATATPVAAATVPDALGQETVPQDVVAQEAVPVPPISDESTPADSSLPTAVETPEIPAEEPAIELTPSKDQLTKENVEHLPDTSEPVATETVASNIDPGSVVGSATPSHQGQTAPLGRPPMGGFATTAFKATATPGRSASYNRRLFEQQEAVVMPGNHAVDRATVQFGSLGLNGDNDAEGQDVDEDREEAETREQLQHSPTTAPRTSLPPAPRQPSVPVEQQPPHETLPTPKPAPGLPPAPQHTAQQSPSGQLNPPPGVQQPANQQYSQFGRYGQSGDSATPAQKAYDPFGHQAPQSTNQYNDYPGTSQAPGQQQHAASSTLGGLSSAPSEYSAYYTSGEQRSNSYNYNYNQYGQGNQQSAQQDAGASQQRTGSAFGSAAGDSSFPTTQSQQVPSRYAEAQNSGHNTPNPALAGQHGQSQGHGPHQQHGHPSHGGGYGYNHPSYYQQPYYQSYMNQMNQYSGGFGNQGYGPYGGKNQMHGQSHYGYGISPQSSFDQHSSSPAQTSAFGQSSLGREGGFSEYGRSGSTQPSSTQGHSGGNTGFGGSSDPFARQQSGFPGQNQGYGQQSSNQQSGGDDSLKPYGDAKSNAGPSPSLGQQGRPGSATNTSSGGNSNLPPPQSHQQGFGGGYPSHVGGQGQQGNQYGGLGGLGGHQGGQQGHQNQGYGYGAFGGYSGYNNRGGWSANYNH